MHDTHRLSTAARVNYVMVQKPQLYNSSFHAILFFSTASTFTLSSIDTVMTEYI